MAPQPKPNVPGSTSKTSRFRQKTIKTVESKTKVLKANVDQIKRWAEKLEAIKLKQTEEMDFIEGSLDWDAFNVKMGWLRNEEAEPYVRVAMSPSKERALLPGVPFSWESRPDAQFRRAENAERRFSTLAKRRYATKANAHPPLPPVPPLPREGALPPQSPRNTETMMEETKPTTATSAGPSNPLPHLTPSGSAHMVSVTSKPNTVRTAIAVGSVHFSNAQPLSLIRSNSNKKGDVLSVSRIAGIMAAKKCPDIIPLCHPINLSHVGVVLQLFDEAHGGVKVQAKVECTGSTGVEMEALTAVMGAALTVVDMCKAVDKGMRVEGVRVTLKEGGRSGTWREEGWKEVEE